MRPGDPPNINNAKLLIKRLFFDERRYDLGAVGRFKLNERLKQDIPLTQRVLDPKDLMAATKMLIKLRHSGGQVDDIDHLGARRVRTVGELLQNQCRAGLLRTERLIRERMTFDEQNVTPSKLINPKAFAGVIRDFFARSQLSQFMDQTNPLSELTNKRRLRAWPRRSVPRARVLRRPRYPLHPLRPYVPDRDAGRSEHRSDQFDVALRDHRRVRIPRNPLPQGG